jgi:hypothetical protein
MGKVLLLEYLSFEVSPQQLREGLSSEKNLVVEGIIQRANAKNQNGRIYPRDVLGRVVDIYIKGPITENRALGELDHPESPTINLKNVSHNVKKVWWDGDDLYGRIEVLKTPSGNILKTLFLEGVTVGISSRGMGSVKQMSEGTVEVQDDFELMAWDFVSTPSTFGAYVRPVKNNLKEGRMFNQSAPVVKSQKYSNVNNLITEILCNRAGFCYCEADAFSNFNH